MRRPMLLSAAIVFFAFEQWSFYRWMQQNGSVRAGLLHAWETLQRDPMVFMAWNDMAIFTAFVLYWLARDLRASGRSAVWWPATLLLGCPPFLIYLATRRDDDAVRSGAHD